jgi:hypothetical protein
VAIFLVTASMRARYGTVGWSPTWAPAAGVDRSIDRSPPPGIFPMRAPHGRSTGPVHQPDPRARLCVEKRRHRRVGGDFGSADRGRSLVWFLPRKLAQTKWSKLQANRRVPSRLLALVYTLCTCSVVSGVLCGSENFWPCPRQARTRWLLADMLP